MFTKEDRYSFKFVSAALAATVVYLAAGDALAGDKVAQEMERAPAADKEPALAAGQTGPHKEINLGVAVTLTILPGFGAGHFYADDVKRGITYLVVDSALWGFGISSFIMQALSTAPTYTKIALILFPLVFAGMKAVEIWDVVGAVEVANNRYLKPVGMTEYDTCTAMSTLVRF